MNNFDLTDMNTCALSVPTSKLPICGNYLKHVILFLFLTIPILAFSQQTISTSCSSKSPDFEAPIHS